MIDFKQMPYSFSGFNQIVVNGSKQNTSYIPPHNIEKSTFKRKKILISR